MQSGRFSLTVFLLFNLFFVYWYLNDCVGKSFETQTLNVVSHSKEDESPNEGPRYHLLPSLREQAEIQDAWTDERLKKVPSLLKKHNVDAWLVSQS